VLLVQRRPLRLLEEPGREGQQEDALTESGHELQALDSEIGKPDFFQPATIQ
jgi:hypothetical protein